MCSVFHKMVQLAIRNLRGGAGGIRRLRLRAVYSLARRLARPFRAQTSPGGPLFPEKPSRVRIHFTKKSLHLLVQGFWRSGWDSPPALARSLFSRSQAPSTFSGADLPQRSAFSRKALPGSNPFYKKTPAPPGAGILAERVGFEPTVSCPTTDFESVPL